MLYPWLCLWDRTLDLQKAQRLTGDQFKGWINLLMLANRQGERGRLPDIPTIAFSLRMDDDAAQQLIDELTCLKFIDKRGNTLTMHDWESWQHRAKTSAERSRDWRESERTKALDERSEERLDETGCALLAPACAPGIQQDRTEEERTIPPYSPPPNGGMSPDGDLSASFVLPTGTRKKAKADDVPFKIPDWIPVDDWMDFEAMRKKNRKPLTDRARRGIVKELAKLQAEGHAPPAVLEQSIRNCWQDVFPIRQPNNGKPGQAAPVKRNPTLSEYEASQARIAAGKARTEELNRLTREARDA